MPIKTYKPTSPGRRDMTGYSFEGITRSKPETVLLEYSANARGATTRVA
jgi:large subunit ribosomal protein L2